jgi:hypothetical protein
MTKTLNLTLPAPHPKQREIESCDKKRIVIDAGRQAGKTFMVSRKAILLANAGKRVLYAAPVQAQTDAFWEYINDWLADALQVGLVKKNEQRRTLLFRESGGRIQARTAHKPDHLRGGWGDYIILDEYAYQDPVMWSKVCQPMLLKNNGTAVFISTPNLRNHFYHLYLKALQDPEWAVFTFSSLDNPHLSEKALKSMIQDMTAVDYRQEILAEFVPGIGAVFQVSPEDFYAPGPLDLIRLEHRDHRLVAGNDWGQKEDYTVLSIGCATCQKELYIGRIKEVDYPTQRDFIATKLKLMYNTVELLSEANAMGQPNIEQLWHDGISTIPFYTTNASKAGIIQELRLCFIQHSWKWVDDPTAWLELESFEMKLGRSGLPIYGAPEGLHDDTVIARALMLHQATMGRFTLA